MFERSANDNSTFNGYTFARIVVEPVYTTINIKSHFHVLNSAGKIQETRLDPLADNSWFNGQTLSVIKLDYYKANRDSNYSSINYKDLDRLGTITDNFYGNSYVVYFTEIEGYTLTSFKYLGVDYYISICITNCNCVC